VTQTRIRCSTCHSLPVVVCPKTVPTLKSQATKSRSLSVTVSLAAIAILLLCFEPCQNRIFLRRPVAITTIFVLFRCPSFALHPSRSLYSFSRLFMPNTWTLFSPALSSLDELSVTSITILVITIIILLLPLLRLLMDSSRTTLIVLVTRMSVVLVLPSSFSSSSFSSSSSSSSSSSRGPLPFKNRLSGLGHFRRASITLFARLLLLHFLFQQSPSSSSQTATIIVFVLRHHYRPSHHLLLHPSSFHFPLPPFPLSLPSIWRPIPLPFEHLHQH
jgi:hypothetical protein